MKGLSRNVCAWDVKLLLRFLHISNRCSNNHLWFYIFPYFNPGMYYYCKLLLLGSALFLLVTSLYWAMPIHSLIRKNRVLIILCLWGFVWKMVLSLFSQITSNVICICLIFSSSLFPSILIVFAFFLNKCATFQISTIINRNHPYNILFGCRNAYGIAYTSWIHNHTHHSWQELKIQAVVKIIL